MAEAPLPKELWQWLAEASTATVTTQLFKRGLRRMHLQGVHPVSRGRRLAGEALTLRYIPAREDLDVVEVSQLGNERELEEIGNVDFTWSSR